MPVYEYTALDLKGKNTSGIIDADGAVAARQKLRASRIFPISIKETSIASSQKKAGSLSTLRPFSRVKQSEVSMMTRQLATLVDAGFPLVSAIFALIPQTKSQALKKQLSHIKDSIEEGNSFAGALSMYPGTFSSIYVNMVNAGETSGTLEVVLERLADISEKQQALNNRLKSALAYPVLMSLIGAIVLFLLLAFIVPSITTIFTDMNQMLPGPTRFLILLSDLLKSFWWLILIMITGMILFVRKIKKIPKGRYLIDKLLLFLPLISPLVKKLAVARFARTLASLLENGVTMLTALGIVKNIVGNVLISDAVEKATKQVEQGHGLGISLDASKIFPHISIQMIQVGEQSGKLETLLNKVSDLYENDVELSVSTMTSLLEPVIILIMGIIVGFIVLSICLPIFEMNQLIK